MIQFTSIDMEAIVSRSVLLLVAVPHFTYHHIVVFVWGGWMYKWTMAKAMHDDITLTHSLYNK